jgi:hypothetical protein
MDRRLRFLCDWKFFCELLFYQMRQKKMICRLSPGLFGWRTHDDTVTRTLWKLHFEEHESFIEELLARPELNELGVFSGREREEFRRRARQYRYDRLWDDYARLPWAERLRSVAWMMRRFRDPSRRTLTKHVGKLMERRVKRLIRGLPKSTTPSSAEAPTIAATKLRTYRTLSENAHSLAIMPFYDASIMETHQHTILVDFDNGMHLWPYRKDLTGAQTVRLFYANYNRMYERVLHEVLKYVAVGKDVEILIGGNQHLQWFGLKAVADRLFPGQFVLSNQENIAGDFYIIRLRRQHPLQTYLRGDTTGWSFGLLTMGNKPKQVLAFVESIGRSVQEEYEILVVTPRRLDYLDGIKYLRQIVFNERDEVGWITRKKNLICQTAQYSDILICHDRYELSPTFCSDWKTWGYSYGIAAPRVRLCDGRRGLDWAVASSQNYTWSHGGLLDYRSYSPYVYVPGGATAVRKTFWEKFPWNENLYWNEHEDVELCRRAQHSGEIISLAAATLIAGSDRWIDQNPLLPFDTDSESLFGGPVGEQRIDFRPLPILGAA